MTFVIAYDISVISKLLELVTWPFKIRSILNEVDDGYVCVFYKYTLYLMTFLP